MKKHGCKTPHGTLFPFMTKKMCVHNIQIKHCNLQPTEGKTMAVISLPKDGLNCVRLVAIWFRPSLGVVGSLCRP